MLTAADIEKIEIEEGVRAPRLVATIRGREGEFEFIFAQHTVAAMRNNQKMMKRVIASRQNSRDSFEEAA
ncbi:hypothetical protein [Vibrio crassostreae]|uniref:hypothetical protein n=1 Tax=Vibrio crassostreae TaxID=246167 RepID=UPI001B3174ED|nr:hypothetical protein [Vibrio crassostreae]